MSFLMKRVKAWMAGTSPAMTTYFIFSIRHRHGAQRLPLARRQFFGLRLQLAAGGKDVAATRRAHRRRIAGVENIFGEFLDSLPVGAFISRARPRIERNEVDLGRNPLQ